MAMSLNTNGRQVGGVKPKRIPSLVAGIIRQRIIDGEIGDGEWLPKEEDLRLEFGVGRPAMREAMRILESEQLITVLRGNRGGATARRPQADNTAYALGLVLASRQVAVTDVALALRELEPVCAVLCATRSEAVGPLEESYSASVDALDAGAPVGVHLRTFHETLALESGNSTLALVVGSLEQLWSSQVDADTNTAGVARSSEEIAQSVDEHRQLLEAIRGRDQLVAREISVQHASRLRSQANPANAPRPIDLSSLREHFSR